MTLAPLKKACRCRGSSVGVFRTPCGPVPVAIGIMFGIEPTLRCEKCGKKWKRKKPKARRKP
jgi:hypothetical protein